MGLLDSILPGLANPYGAPSTGEWNLSQGVYTRSDGFATVFWYEKDPKATIKTGIDQITDTGGRRTAVYEYPYRDGQRVTDLGRKGETYAFNIKFFGNDYQTLFNAFISNVVNTSLGGTLTHPVRSSQKGIKVRFRDYEFLHRYDEWNAVTIKATFIEDNTTDLASTNTAPASTDSALRDALQVLSNAQSTINTAITSATAALLLPNSVTSALSLRLTSIVDSVSDLFGQLAATYSGDGKLQTLAGQAATADTAITNLTSAVAVQQTSAGSVTASIPAVYQVGFDQTTQTAIAAQTANFVSANQISPKQAVYTANQIRTTLTAAITEVQGYLGNLSYDIVVAYRGIAVSVQTAVEASLAIATANVTYYTVPRPMSLRTVAFLNGLPPENQNLIESMNPYLTSVNLVPAGTILQVPVA